LRALPSVVALNQPWPRPAGQQPKLDPGTVGLGGFLAAAFVLLVYSRLPDVAFGSLRLPFVVAVLSLLVGGTRLPRVLTSPPGLLLLALTAWFGVCTFFSVWRGGSVALLRDKWFDSFLIFLLTATLIRTPKAARLVAAALGFSGVLIVGLVLLLGTTDVDGRLVLPHGTLANSNYLAMHLLMALPLILLPAYEAGRSVFARLLAWGLGLAALGFMLATGSRGVVVAFGVMVLATFALTSGRGRAKMLVAVALAGILGAALIPETISDRIATTWGGGVNDDLDDEGLARAVGSTEARRALLINSLMLTAKHPIVGVGPGMFAVAENDRAAADGREGAWHETHNTYTQLSSEAGLPSLAIYLALMLWCWTQVRKIRAKCAQDAPEYQPLTVAVEACLVGYAAVGVFASLAYDLYFPSLVGFYFGFSQAFLGAEGKPAKERAPRRVADAV